MYWNFVFTSNTNGPIRSFCHDHDVDGAYSSDGIISSLLSRELQVSPAEIEEVIYTHPAIKRACVVGIDDDSAGEVPLACVIVKEGHKVTKQEIIKLVEGKNGVVSFSVFGVGFLWLLHCNRTSTTK